MKTQDKANHPWRVTSDVSFWNEDSTEPAAALLPFSGQFDWAGRHWVVPGVYAAEKALVVDICYSVEATEMRAFLEQWGWTPDCDQEDPREFTPQEAARIEAESPMGLSFRGEVLVNGVPLSLRYSAAAGYRPFLSQRQWEAREVVTHYGLDPDQCWQIFRCAFSWEHVQPVETLSLTLEEESRWLPGETFQIQPGEQMELTHPQTGERYTLTAWEQTPDTIDSPFPWEDVEFPTHLWKLVYTLEPPLEDFSLRDAQEGDPTRPKAPREGVAEGGVIGVAALHSQKEPEDAASVGVIGGAVGATSIGVIGGEEEAADQAAGKQVAFSNPCFVPTDSVSWFPEFRQSAAPAITIPLEKQA